MSWEIGLLDGQVLRSGDVLEHDGEVRQRREDGSRNPEERNVLESDRVHAERFRSELFDQFHWSFEQIMRDSPLQVSERDPKDQFRNWLKLWPAHCHVWIGDVFSSGKRGMARISDRWPTAIRSGRVRARLSRFRNRGHLLAGRMGKATVPSRWRCCARS